MAGSSKATLKAIQAKTALATKKATILTVVNQIQSDLKDQILDDINLVKQHIAARLGEAGLPIPISFGGLPAGYHVGISHVVLGSESGELYHLSVILRNDAYEGYLLSSIK